MLVKHHDIIILVIEAASINQIILNVINIIITTMIIIHHVTDLTDASHVTLWDTLRNFVKVRIDVQVIPTTLDITTVIVWRMETVEKKIKIGEKMNLLEIKNMPIQ